ncbi:hypothetical protein FB45DRAFT_892842 [Roridomyces roridus]|uniref:Uncharacterized protein n=1 Tax=Roridomyces roridus TaxID=1738132 RepID=A0AAD7G006_9AGAR|nr:hypothetical protein FB45DRAFT_892842 [Roridomyces roridus]
MNNVRVTVSARRRTIKGRKWVLVLVLIGYQCFASSISTRVSEKGSHRKEGTFFPYLLLGHGKKLQVLQALVCEALQWFGRCELRRPTR